MEEYLEQASQLTDIRQQVKVFPYERCDRASECLLAFLHLFSLKHLVPFS